MDPCDDCGAIFAPLLLWELHDGWGSWTEWLCELCADKARKDVHVLRMSSSGIDLVLYR